MDPMTPWRDGALDARMQGRNDIVSGRSAGARLASLDGWRAIFIAVVLSSHFGPLDTLTAGSLWLNGLLHDGELAVRCFFVLSGFLITGLLISEANQAGTINVIGFLYRRALRLLPVYFIFLGTLFAAQLAGYLDIASDRWISAVTFTANFRLGLADWPLFHLWSLSIEQQFYLAWPFVLIALKPWQRLRAMAMFTIGVVVFVVAFRLAAGAINFWIKPDIGRLNWLFSGTTTFHFIDGLAAGSLAACLLFHFQSVISRTPFWLVSVFAAVTALMLVLPAMAAPGTKILRLLLYLTGNTISAVGCAILLVISTVFSNRWPFRLLCMRPLAMLGTISYSLYIWQQPFTTLWLQECQANARLAVVIVVATLSYWLLERPFTKMRARLRLAGGDAFRTPDIASLAGAGATTGAAPRDA
jgi:peptidoglycan/LPS O-acetylase OafA/YrhL